MPELAPSRRIAADLRRAIRSGEYGPGHQLPSGSVLMARYGVARQTVQNAIDLLRLEVLVMGRSGAGWFVREPPVVQRLARNRLSRGERSAGWGTFVTDATAGGWTPSVQVSVCGESADERIAAELHIAVGDEILVRERVMSADGQAVQLATSRLPRTLTAGTAIEHEDTGPGGIYARLEEAGHQLDHFVERVTCRIISDAESSALQVHPGSPVLAVTRTAYDTNGMPVETNDMVLAGDRYELIYELPAN